MLIEVLHLLVESRSNSLVHCVEHLRKPFFDPCQDSTKLCIAHPCSNSIGLRVILISNKNRELDVEVCDHHLLLATSIGLVVYCLINQQNLHFTDQRDKSPFIKKSKLTKKWMARSFFSLRYSGDANWLRLRISLESFDKFVFYNNSDIIFLLSTD